MCPREVWSKEKNDSRNWKQDEDIQTLWAPMTTALPETREISVLSMNIQRSMKINWCALSD